MVVSMIRVFQVKFYDPHCLKFRKICDGNDVVVLSKVYPKRVAKQMLEYLVVNKWRLGVVQRYLLGTVVAAIVLPRRLENKLYMLMGDSNESDSNESVIVCLTSGHCRPLTSTDLLSFMGSYKNVPGQLTQKNLPMPMSCGHGYYMFLKHTCKNVDVSTCFEL